MKRITLAASDVLTVLALVFTVVSGELAIAQREAWLLAPTLLFLVLAVYALAFRLGEE